MVVKQSHFFPEKFTNHHKFQKGERRNVYYGNCFEMAITCSVIVNKKLCEFGPKPFISGGESKDLKVVHVVNSDKARLPWVLQCKVISEYSCFITHSWRLRRFIDLPLLYLKTSSKDKQHHEGNHI